MEPHMKKVLLFVLAVGISNATALPIAHAMDIASFVTTESGKVLPYYAADYRRERRAYRHTHRLSDYPYYRGCEFKKVETRVELGRLQAQPFTKEQRTNG